MKEYFNTYRLRSHDNLRFLVASNSSGLYSFHWDMVRLDYSLAPRAIRLLAEHGADALRPSLVNGRFNSSSVRFFFNESTDYLIRFASPYYFTSRYLGPLISRRQAGDLRKRAIIRGTFGQFSYPAGMIAYNPYFVNLRLGGYYLKWNLGGWDPAWDEEKKMFIMKPHKGHKRERDRESRLGISVSPILFIFQLLKEKLFSQPF